MALRRRQERKLADFLFRISGYSFEQRPQVTEHPPRRIVINSVAIKKNFQLQFGTIIDCQTDRVVRLFYDMNLAVGPHTPCIRNLASDW